MNELTAKQMESAALATMQRFLEKFSEEHDISYETALQEFSKSDIYKELFDFSSNLWTQGPDYLMSLYELALSMRK